MTHTCGPEPAHRRRVDAAASPRLSGAWARGDGSSSTRLPDGRILWLFGDTLTGSVDVRRAAHAGARSCTARSVVHPRNLRHAAWPPAPPRCRPPTGSWLWPTHAVVTRAGSRGRRAARCSCSPSGCVRTGTGAFDFRRVGTAAVAARGRLGRSRSRWARPSTSPMPSVLWGAALVARGAHDVDLRDTRRRARHLRARPAAGEGADAAPWQTPARWVYRTADGWSRGPATRGRPARRLRRRLDRRLRRARRRPLRAGHQAAGVPRRRASSRWRPRTPGGRGRSAPSSWRRRPSDRPQYSPALVAGAPPGDAVVVVNRTSTSLADLRARSDAWPARRSTT